MSRRLRSAEESARRETAAAKEAAYTLVADSTAPRDPRRQGDHYRKHLADAHRIIETLQLKVKELEAERDKVKRDAEYSLSLCVTRREAEEGRLGGFRLAKHMASDMAEGPHGIPTNLSEAIHNMPDPKPRWSK